MRRNEMKNYLTTKALRHQEGGGKKTAGGKRQNLFHVSEFMNLSHKYSQNCHPERLVRRSFSAGGSRLSAEALAKAGGIYCQKCKDSSTPLRSVGMTKARKVAENQ